MREVLSHHVAEFEITMGLSGCTSVADINRETCGRRDFKSIAHRFGVC
ncbi:MAG: hypothetical protein ACRD0P_07315 [Stackebrandtia sp.]